MWVVVTICAVWGPDFVSTSGSGTTSTTIPSGIAVAVFATIGTWVVAKYGFGRRSSETCALTPEEAPAASSGSLATSARRFVSDVYWAAGSGFSSSPSASA
jgi:hypothetical protein